MMFAWDIIRNGSRTKYEIIYFVNFDEIFPILFIESSRDPQ